MDKALFRQISQTILVIMKGHMKKKIIASILVILFSASAVFAQAVKQPTGNSYLAMSKQDRVSTVTNLISDVRQSGIVIKQSPISYCKGLDSFYGKHPDMKSQPLAAVLKTLIVMEYDWQEKGVDKDKLARQILGDKVYQENKARLANK